MISFEKATKIAWSKLLRLKKWESFLLYKNTVWTTSYAYVGRVKRGAISIFFPIIHEKGDELKLSASNKGGPEVNCAIRIPTHSVMKKSAVPGDKTISYLINQEQCLMKPSGFASEVGLSEIKFATYEKPEDNYGFFYQPAFYMKAKMRVKTSDLIDILRTINEDNVSISIHQKDGKDYLAVIGSEKGSPIGIIEGPEVF